MNERLEQLREKCMTCLKKKGYVFFLLCLWIIYSLYIMHFSYFKAIYISPDSSNYLREADALTNGYGFNVYGMAGGYKWFSSWPIGYPSLIAFFSFIFKCNAYLGSKILTIFLIGLELLFIGIHYKKNSWIYGIVLVNYGIMTINCYPWSETAFMPLLLIYVFTLSKVVSSECCSVKYYVILGITMMCSFLIRYFGGFTVIVSFLILFILVLFAFYNKHIGTTGCKRKLIRLFITNSVAGLCMVGYLLFNRIMSGYATGVDRTKFNDELMLLFKELIISLHNEVRNIFSILVYLPIDSRYWAIITIPIFSVLGYFIIKRIGFSLKGRCIDETTVFLIVGLAYYVIFTVVRFKSSMDTFGFRFWAPASMLILMGLVSYYLEWETARRNDYYIQLIRIAVYCIGMVLMIAGVFILVYQDIQIQSNNTAYAKIEKEITMYFKEVPAESIVLERERWIDENSEEHNGEEYNSTYVNYFRPDIVILPWVWNDKTCQKNSTSLEELKFQYRDFKHICISTFCAREEILANPEEYDPSLVSYIKHVLSLSNDDSKFIIIPTDK